MIGISLNVTWFRNTPLGDLVTPKIYLLLNLTHIYDISSIYYRSITVFPFTNAPPSPTVIQHYRRRFAVVDHIIILQQNPHCNNDFQTREYYVINLFILITQSCASRQRTAGVDVSGVINDSGNWYLLIDIFYMP